MIVRYWNHLISQPHPVRRILSRVLWRSGLCSFFRIEHNGFRLRFHPSSFSACLWIDPRPLREDDEFFAAYLRPGDVVVDVGANIGTLSLAASRAIGPAGKVYSFEPHPRTFRFLQHNLALNRAGNVTAYNLAAGNCPGTLPFSNKAWDDQNTVQDGGQGLSVAVQTLDGLLPPKMRVNLLKIDVEGYEKFVLEGAANTLKRTDAVYSEVWQEHFDRFGYRFSDIWRLLRQSGFAVFHADKAENLSPVAESYVPLQCQNLVALRNIDEYHRRTNTPLLMKLAS